MDRDSKDMNCDLPNVGSGVAGELTRWVRYGLMTLGGYLIGKGYLQQDTVDAVVAIGTTATPIIIGTIIGRINQKKLVKAVEIAKSKSNGEGE